MEKIEGGQKGRRRDDGEEGRGGERDDTFEEGEGTRVEERQG